MMEGREWSQGQSHKEEEREGGSGTGEGPGTVSSGGRALFGYLCRGPPSSYSYATILMGPVCLLSQGRFEEPVCAGS